MPLPFNQESWIWYTVAVMMIGARLISRTLLFRSLKGLQYDDWIMGLFVTSCYTVLIVLSNKWLKVQSNLEPPGFNFSTLTASELANRRYGSKLVIVVEQMQITVIWSCKACLLIMYHRLTRTALRNENIAIKLLSAYVASGFVIMEILYFGAWCLPFSGYYAVPVHSAQCNDLINHRITKAVFNLSSDLIMLGIALQMLIRSLLPFKRKIILCGIFSLGIFVITASILNSYYSFKNPYKQAWIYWYVRESSTAILVANLPFTWNLLKKFFELSDFDDSNHPPWTYHSSRTAGGRRTAQLLHQTNTTTTSTGRNRSSYQSHKSKSNNSMLGVGSTSTANKHVGSLMNSTKSSNNENELLDEAIQPHDFAPALLLSSSDGGITNIDLEQSATSATSPTSPSDLLPESLYHAYQRDSMTSHQSKITEDGTGGFYLNNRPISTPSRAYLAASSSRSRAPSVVSMERRPRSPTPSFLSSALDGKGRRGSAPTIGHMSEGTTGGGRSARDRRKRARLSHDLHA